MSPSKKLELFGWGGSVEHQRRKNVSVSRESREPGVVWMEGIREWVSGGGEIGLVSSRLLVAPCCARESNALDSLSKWSEAGAVSYGGYFRVWVGLLGLLSASVLYQVLECLPATAAISSWHPSGENSSSWKLLVAEQIGCVHCCIKQEGSFEVVWVFYSLQQKAKWAFHCHLGRKIRNGGGLECCAHSGAGLASGVISSSDPNEVFRTKCKSCGGKWIEILKLPRNSAVCSSLQPSLLIGQICQLSAIKQPFYFFTARQCFNSLKAFCCGYKLKVWCSLQQH